jgi:hypothetical protein
MLPDKTTTMGEGELERMDRVFQSMKAVLRTRAKFRTWRAVWRGWWRREGGSDESITIENFGGSLWTSSMAVDAVIG